MLQLFFDVETKNSMEDVGGHFPERLDISFIGARLRDSSSGQEETKSFFEQDLDKFCDLLDQADVIIGYNSDGFDLPTLTRHYQGNLKSLPSLDLMARIKKSCGHRISLDAVSKATFDSGKTGSGIDAINYYKQGRLQELADYCLQDVKITRDLYDFGFKNGFVKFYNKWNRLIKCPVDFDFRIKPKLGKQDALF
ncbi:ribonuclease H-like domain-containing protein [Microgenomates group bacterium]|nr:ribonuclease H-like domain-containing protein [Microgenomates group bacterium]